MLPKNFSDAIELTKELGIPYIWIDALCIVQDDNEEWQTEAGRMDQIYLGSQLTIAAAQSSDTTGGCFPSTPAKRRGGDFFFRTPVLKGDIQRRVRAYNRDVLSDVEKDAPLSRRGWTLQEDILSHRIAWCMQPEIHWRCQAHYQTECGLQFTPAEMINPLVPVMKAPPSILRSGWSQIAENYSCRKFTVVDDRVAAICGISRHLAARIQDEPILGLWAGDFCRGLSWLRIRCLESELSPLAASLPSWSWLACPGAVLFDLWGFEKKRANRIKAEDHLRLLDWSVEWEVRRTEMLCQRCTCN